MALILTRFLGRKDGEGMIMRVYLLLIAISLISCQPNSGHKSPKGDLDALNKKITEVLPGGWTSKIINSTESDEIVIQSVEMALEPDMTSNDRLDPIGTCDIYVLMEPKISVDSIGLIRKRNQDLKSNLPSQNSKDNLENWYKENENALKLLDAEPTHYDDKYSYRIKCRRLPKYEKDKKEHEKIMDFMNSLFKKYEMNGMRRRDRKTGQRPENGSG